MNPLYKEFLAQLIEGGRRVADNPVHLADFGECKEQSSLILFVCWLVCLHVYDLTILD